MSSAPELIARGEQAFVAGDVADARRLFEQALETADDAAVRAEILNDLAVIAAGTGSPAEAEALLLDALRADAAHAPALENLAGLCSEAEDLVQASHWWRRAMQAAPDDPRPREELARVLVRRRRFDDARGLGAGIPVPAVRPPAPVPPGEIAPAGGRVLIVVDFFHPSVGGSERLAECAGVALQREGFTVDVATRRLAERTSTRRLGMTVHELDGDAMAGLTAVVAQGAYDSVLVFSAPTSWPLVCSLQLPHPRPRVVVVPCINPDNHGVLHRQPGLLQSYAALVHSADVVGYSSLTGLDVRLCEELGLDGVYVPNAVEHVPPARPFRAAHGIDDDAPLLLAVGNMWPEKNHAGLLRALRDVPGDWRLALVGAPSPLEPRVADEVKALAASDPRVTLVGPAAPEVVSAAMEEASALLLPSLAEATPLVLLEAMSHGLPWIATPTCGAAHDHAGGLIVPLDLFGHAIDSVLCSPGAAADLGAAGRAHFEAAYSWDVMGPRYARVLRGLQVEPAFGAPADAVAATETARAALYDARVAAGVLAGR